MVSQRQLARAAGVSEVTLRKLAEELRRMIVTDSERDPLPSYLWRLEELLLPVSPSVNPRRPTS